MSEGTARVERRGAAARAQDPGARRIPPLSLTMVGARALGGARFLLCLGVLAAATVTADLALAPGVAGGVLHLALVLLAWWGRGPRQVAAVAAFASLLVGLGLVLRFDPASAQAALLDRALALLAIWGAAAVLIAAKRREQALRRSEASLAARVREQAAELTVTQTRAQLASRSRSEFFARMGHELRTPLNAIIGFSEIIKDEIFGPVGSARYREYMADIHHSGHHLLALINDLLAIARIEVGKAELEERPVAVAELVQAALAAHADLAARAGVTLDASLPAGLAELRADGRKLRQVLDNLLSNAIKFTPTGGAVTVAVWTSPEEGYVLRVRDQGIGMALKDLPVALAPFGQVENALCARHEGSGLGLPLSKALVELHSGRLELASEPGVGTTVTLRFPAERILAVPRVA